MPDSHITGGQALGSSGHLETNGKALRMPNLILWKKVRAVEDSILLQI
jgi:hypothetical protein